MCFSLSTSSCSQDPGSGCCTRLEDSGLVSGFELDTIVCSPSDTLACCWDVKQQANCSPPYTTWACRTRQATRVEQPHKPQNKSSGPFLCTKKPGPSSGETMGSTEQLTNNNSKHLHHHQNQGLQLFPATLTKTKVSLPPLSVASPWWIPGQP